MSKANSFVKFLKNINKIINSLLEKNLNKLNFKNIIKIAQSNKIFLTFVALVILFLSYLSIPYVYNKSKVLVEFENYLINNFNLEFHFSKKLNYSFFPTPHFSSSEIIIKNKKKKISEIKKIKIFISLNKLFSLNNIKINKVILEEANFNLNSKNYDFFINILNNDFFKSTFIIYNSNIFFKNLENEVLFINKVKKMKFYFDQNEMKNVLYSENEIFNIPYSLVLFDNKTNKKIYSKLNLDILRLQIENYYNYKEDVKFGTSDIIYNKLKSTFKYKIDLDKDNFEFNLFNKLDNPKFSYKGKLNFKPFYSSLDGKEQELDLSYFFNSSGIIANLIKTKMFNDNNINFKLKIRAEKFKKIKNFKNIILNSKIEKGLIDIDNSSFRWRDYVDFQIFDSLLHVKDGELVLDGATEVNLIEPIELYKFLQTPKKLRKKIKKVNFNYKYNFDQKIISFKDIRIDNKYNQNVNKTIDNVLIKNDDLQNKIYFKKLINKAIKNYAG